MKFSINDNQYNLVQVINNVLEKIVDENGNFFYLKRFGSNYNSSFSLLDVSKKVLISNVTVICL